MAINPKIAVLAFVLLHTTTSVGFFRISEQIGDSDPIVLAGSFNQKGISLDPNASMFSKLFENDSLPTDFVKKAASNLLENIGGSSVSFNGHPKPDEKTKKAYVKLLLRRTRRRIRNVEDIKRFLDQPQAPQYAGIENPCDGLEEPCPYLDLRKKQLGRALENINDEIVFIEEILKKKDCKYLRLKLGLLKRDADSVEAVIKYIDDHNKLADNRKDFIELLKHIVCNALSNLRDVEEFLRGLLDEETTTLAVFEEKPTDHEKCPYLKLQEKLQWREAVNRADNFGFVFWLRRRHSHSRRDCWKLKRKIRRTIRRLVEIYKGNRRHRRHHRRHPRTSGTDSLFDGFAGSSMPLFGKSFDFGGIAESLRSFNSKLGLDRDLFQKDRRVTETA